MAVLSIHYYCDAVQMTSVLYAALPEKPPVSSDGYKTVFLLPAEGEEGVRWLWEYPIERLAREREMAFIMLPTLQGCYTDMRYGYRFFEAALKEIPAFLERNIISLNLREHCAVAGISMGGMGALKLALCDSRYEDVCCLSGRVDNEYSFRNPLKGDYMTVKRMTCLWGTPEEIAGTKDDIDFLAKEALRAGRRPNIYMSCAKEDAGYKSCERFSQVFGGEFNIKFNAREGRLGQLEWGRELTQWLDSQQTN